MEPLKYTHLALKASLTDLHKGYGVLNISFVYACLMPASTLHW